jgi:kynurenine formamidase
VDLTQPLGPATVLWPGSRPFAAHVAAAHDTDGLYHRDLDVPEHAGTHLDAPSHFAPGGAHVADIPLADLVRPAVVLDVRDLVGDDPRFTLGADRIARIEARDGRIPAGSAVLVCTGWDRHVGDAARYIGTPGPACPGIGPDAARLLVERGVAGIGIDTLGVDPGHAADVPSHRITLPAGLWHLEGLVGLDRLPARGAWLVAGVVRLVEGSGAPARVFAVLPG